MAKDKNRKKSTKPKVNKTVPTPGFFSKKNRILLGIGIIDVITGFYALAQEPKDGFMSMKVAPVLLIIGFLVIIPLGILLGDKKE